MPSEAAAVALICAVPAECAALHDALREVRAVEVGRKQAFTGVLDDVPILLMAAGMGKVNAAQAATALLERRPGLGLVIDFGVAGAYPGSGLSLDDVALASHAVYGDEGVETPAGWISTREIGIPLLEHAGRATFNEFTLDPVLVARAADALRGAGTAVAVGPFVTLSCCTGTTARAEVIAARFGGALCETMEGTAVAHVCALYGVPFLELRAVSNLVEDRDLSRWRIAEAAAAAQRAVRIVAAALGTFPVQNRA